MKRYYLQNANGEILAISDFPIRIDQIQLKQNVNLYVARMWNPGGSSVTHESAEKLEVTEVELPE